MISLWKLREKKNVAQMPFVKNTPALLETQKSRQQPVFWSSQSYGFYWTVYIPWPAEKLQSKERT